MAEKQRFLTPKQRAVLQANCWKPGQSGNPKGRPRGEPTLKECLRLLLELRCAKGKRGVEGFDRAVEIAEKIFGKHPQTYRELLAMMMIAGAVMAAGKGNTKPAMDIRDTVDGKPSQEFQISGDLQINLPAIIAAQQEGTERE